jgi:hypothetical protein
MGSNTIYFAVLVYCIIFSAYSVYSVVFQDGAWGTGAAILMAQNISFSVAK